jgi:lysophospholipid acyltransferase (LPLAT)-like uncharacterized protein
MSKKIILNFAKFLTKKPYFALIIKYLIYIYLRIIFMTYRLETKSEVENTKEIKHIKGIFYFWHQNLIAIMFFLFKNKIISHCIISPSRDGQIMGFIFKKFGFKVVYNSPYKSSIKQIRHTLNILDVNKRIFLAGDGSRGPAFQLQRSVKYFAIESGLPLVFINSNSKHALTFNSWDKFKVPLPFSKISVNIHKPKFVEKNSYKNKT